MTLQDFQSELNLFTKLTVTLMKSHIFPLSESEWLPLQQ